MTNNEILSLNKKGLFRVQDAAPMFSTNNVNFPAGLLAQLSPVVVENILSKRSGEEVAGSRRKVLDWADEDFYIPLIERTGETTPYSDFGQSRVAGINPTFERGGHYRFSVSLNIGNLEEEQLAKAKINAYDYKMSAAGEALEVEANRAAFEGYISNSSNAYLCYGILNHPNLPAYTAASKQFSAMTYDELMAFFAAAIAKLTTQTGNQINVNSKIRVAIASDAFAYLAGLVTTFGYSALEGLKKAYPNMEFVSTYEFNGAYNSQNVIYFIGESAAGGVAETLELGYSELMRQSNVVVEHEFRSQQISSGVTGAIVYKPLFIVRYNNI